MLGCGFKDTTQSSQNQDCLNQSQKIPWRSRETLWGRNNYKIFCISRHKIPSDCYCKEKPVRKCNKQLLILTWDVAPVLDSSEKERTYNDINAECSNFSLCAAQQLENIRTVKFLSISSSWEATQCTTTHCYGSSSACQPPLGQIQAVFLPLKWLIWNKLLKSWSLRLKTPWSYPEIFKISFQMSS